MMKIIITTSPPSDSLLTRCPLEWVIASVNPQLGSKSMNYDINLIFFVISTLVIIIMFTMVVLIREKQVVDGMDAFSI